MANVPGKFRALTEAGGLAGTPRWVSKAGDGDAGRGPAQGIFLRTSLRRWGTAFNEQHDEAKNGVRPV